MLVIHMNCVHDFAHNAFIWFSVAIISLRSVIKKLEIVHLWKISPLKGFFEV